MNNMFKSKALRVVMLLVLVVMCLAVMAGCGQKAVSDIAISESDRPKLSYVQGQELDLSKGKLTVIRDGDVSNIPLDAEGVTVSGYEKNTLGKQTLTVTYEGKTATYDITVVARMVVENNETNYFVGDAFDNSKGRVKVAKNDGSFAYVDLNNQSLSITGFDSANAGTVQVKVSYQDAGETYETTFPVTIHAVGNVTFNRPVKATYQSHETQLVLTGGYLTVTSASDPNFSKYVDLTMDMISGFDPSAATIENRNQALKQTITVAYGGNSFQYEVSILYGAVSLFMDNANQLKDLDWSDENLELSSEQASLAVETMFEYFNMTKADKSQVPEELLHAVVKPAAIYGTKMLYVLSESFSQSFTLNENGNMLLQAKSYDQLVVDRLRLLDTEEPFVQCALLLQEMLVQFSTVEIREGETVQDVIKVPSADEINFYVGLYDFLASLYNSIAVVPDNWTLEDLRNYGDSIDVTVYMMQLGGFFGPTYDYVYDAISSWRTNNDMMEIIYNYYCYVADDGHEIIQQVLWQQMPLPGDMQDWYVAFYKAVSEAQYMANYGDTNAYLHDVTAFMYYYYTAVELADGIKNGDNALYRDLYEIIHGDLYMQDNIICATAGYVSHSNGLVDSENYRQLWLKYLAVYDMYVRGVYNPEENQAEVNAIFDAMMKLNATEMYSFLSSLQYKYMETNGSYHAFDYSTKAGNSFIAVLANHYLANCPEEVVAIFEQLMLAIEDYAIYSGLANTNALDSFRTNMSEVRVAVTMLSDEHKAIFNSMFATAYAKYSRIYESVGTSQSFDIDSATMEQVDALYATILNAFSISEYMSNPSLSQSELRFTCIQLFASYEKAQQLYDALNNSGNADVITLLNTKQYAVGDNQQTLETCYNIIRNNFIAWMFYGLRFEQKDENGESLGSVAAWSLYEGSGLDEFLTLAADLLLAGYNGTTSELSWEYVESVAAALRSQNADNYFQLYGMGIQRYLDCIAAFLRAKIDDQATEELAIAILNAEFGYIVYHAMGYRDQELQYFKQQFENAKQLMESLEDTTVYDAHLKDMYEFYLAYYNTLQ